MSNDLSKLPEYMSHMSRAETATAIECMYHYDLTKVQQLEALNKINDRARVCSGRFYCYTISHQVISSIKHCKGCNCSKCADWTRVIPFD